VTHPLAPRARIHHPYRMDDQPAIPSPRQFLLLFYRAAGAESLSPEDQAARDDAFRDWLRSIETRGELVMAGQLLPGGSARLGPGGDLLEGDPGLDIHLAGVCVIRARDRAGAMDTARRAPQVLRSAGAVVRELDAR
jgi:hypothetical protein